MTINMSNSVADQNFQEEMKGKKNIEVAEILVARLEAENGLCSCEYRWLNWFQAKALAGSGINETNFQHRDGMSVVQKTLGVSVDVAGYVWSLIARFFRMIMLSAQSTWSKLFAFVPKKAIYMV